jgi:hypothetical protein
LKELTRFRDGKGKGKTELEKYFSNSLNRKFFSSSSCFDFQFPNAFPSVTS